MNRLVLAMVLAGATMSVQAQVYKCKEGGKVVFSDVPCAQGGEELKVAPATGHWNAESAARAQQGHSANHAKLQAADNAVRRRILDDDIYRHQTRIKKLTEEMNTRLAQLRDKKRYANNNLAGAVWERSISDEMNAVTSSYGLQIETLQSEIEHMRQQMAALGE